MSDARPPARSLISGLWLASLASAATETYWMSLRVAPGVTSLRTWFGAFGLTMLLALAVGASLAVTIEFIRRSHVRSNNLLGREDAFGNAVTLALLLPLVLAAATVLARFFLRAFSNLELVAFLSSLSALLTLGVGWAAAVSLRAPVASVTRRVPRRQVLALLAGYWITVMALCARWLGLTQLNPGLWLSASTGLLAFVLGRRLPFPATTWLALASLTLSLLLVWQAAVVTPSAVSLLARHGSWSKAAVHRGRLLLDRDGDGYSTLLAGGDCNDRDARVNPAAWEIARDGIDNDCRAGDARQQRPELEASSAVVLPNSVPHQPNVVLLTIETFRPDHLSLFGYRRRTTPRLEKLGESSLVFERVYAPAPATRLSLAALLSGRTPSALRWESQPAHRGTRRISEQNPWLPATLQRAGYRTIAVHTNFRAFTAVEGAGFDRGFDVYDTNTRLAFVGGTFRGFPAHEQIDRALALLDAARPRRPFFLWLHLVEPHYSYEQSPAVPSFGSDEVALYDAELAEVDRQIGRLADALAARSLLEATVLAIAGDHGEEFGEHGERYHASNLYEPQVRTALVLRVPGLPARRVSEPIVLTDLGPTLEALLRLPTLAFSASEGRNLVPLLLGGGLSTSAFFLENFRAESGGQRATALVRWPFKLIHEEEGHTFELYDLQRDPHERHNLYGSSSAAASSLVEHLRARLRSAAFSSLLPAR